MGIFKRNKFSFITAAINDRIGADERAAVYEKPLEDFLDEKDMGFTEPAKAVLLKNGEVDYFEIELDLNGKFTDDVKKTIIAKLEALGAPKGSTITEMGDDESIPFGKLEGLALYLDGKTLDPQVYEECDINYVIDELSRLMGVKSDADRFWEGEEEAALYFYSDSFEDMKASILGFVSEYPLCKNSRIERIA